ncbi:hypothetical protein HK405_007445 [Cladochytrium tenue]|nr:hypothetical protein HK405_007445 [Cladochytrium tenue]
MPSWLQRLRLQRRGSGDSPGAWPTVATAAGWWPPSPRARGAMLLATFVAAASLLTRPDLQAFKRAVHRAADERGGLLVGLVSRIATWFSAPLGLIRFSDYLLFSLVTVEPTLAFPETRRYLGLWGSWIPLPSPADADGSDGVLDTLYRWLIPVCSNCINGLCVGPNVCLCASGLLGAGGCGAPPEPEPPATWARWVLGSSPPGQAAVAGPGPAAAAAQTVLVVLLWLLAALHLAHVVASRHPALGRLAAGLRAHFTVSVGNTVAGGSGGTGRRGVSAPARPHTLLTAPFMHASTVAFAVHAAALAATVPALVEALAAAFGPPSAGTTMSPTAAAAAFVVLAALLSSLGALAGDWFAAGADEETDGSRGGWCGAAGIVAGVRALAMLLAVPRDYPAYGLTAAGPATTVSFRFGGGGWLDTAVWRGAADPATWGLLSAAPAEALREYLAASLVLEALLVHGLDPRGLGAWLGGVLAAYLFHAAVVAS